MNHTWTQITIQQSSLLEYLFQLLVISNEKYISIKKYIIRTKIYKKHTSLKHERLIRGNTLVLYNELLWRNMNIEIKQKIYYMFRN